MICGICGNEFTRKSNAKYCSAYCKQAGRNWMRGGSDDLEYEGPPSPQGWAEAHAAVARILANRKAKKATI
jgi:hypothetical protein